VEALVFLQRFDEDLLVLQFRPPLLLQLLCLAPHVVLQRFDRHSLFEDAFVQLVH
jgi:hypothetical protein